MSGTPLSIGVYAELASAVLKALPRNIDSTTALEWARNGQKLGQALASLLCPPVAPMAIVPPHEEFLGAAVEFTYPALPDPVDPGAFYQTRKGLWIDPNFQRWIILLAAAKKLSALPERAGRYRPLTSSATGDEIYGESRPGSHVWKDANEFCARLAEEIRGQWENKIPGKLIGNGDVNIFHVVGAHGVVVTVSVHWSANGGSWFVCAHWPHSIFRWNHNSRVFPHD